MLCYDIRVRYEKSSLPFGEASEATSEKDRKKDEPELEETIQKLNAGVYALTSDNDFYAFVYRVDDDFLDFAVAAWPDKINMKKLNGKLVWAVKSIYKVEEAEVVSSKEITTKKYTLLLDESENRDYLKRSTRRSTRDLRLDYFENSTYKLNEDVICPDKLSKSQAVQKAKAIMAHSSLLEEVERIYDSKNSTKFYGYPVHYRIQASSRDSALPIIRLMIRMLYNKNRILGTRLGIVTQIDEGCYDEADLKNVIRQAEGSAIVIELAGAEGEHGNFASSYEAVIRYISDLVEKYHQNTLFFFLEDVTNPGFTKELMAKVTDCVDIIDIQEGRGDREEAECYLNRLVKESSYSDLAGDDLNGYLPKQRLYKSSDIHKAFNTWSREVLRNKAYSAYKNCKSAEIKRTKKRGTAYEELKNMVGLNNVKRVADQIIASYKMQSLREEYRMEETSVSKHMVFTGNPGSAKTSVARLLSEILVDEGVLKSGSFVECGRADLVGRYVGWTAKEVRSKFKMAEGGILFIDEAYSLVDDSHSFGDEAINTIVQEMENRRESVIVIFAGYPDKMRDFINRNEGLRSRIAFQLDFPDYNAEELLEIMNIMLKARNLKTDEEAMKKCMSVFMKACKEKEFGNGRFVRNLIDQAVLRQAERLMKSRRNGKVSKSRLQKLCAADFDVNIAELFEKNNKISIGFSA